MATENAVDKAVRRTATALALFKKHSSTNATTLTREQLESIMTELAATRDGEQHVATYLKGAHLEQDFFTFEGLVTTYNAYVEWLLSGHASQPSAAAPEPAPAAPEPTPAAPEPTPAETTKLELAAQKETPAEAEPEFKPTPAIEPATAPEPEPEPEPEAEPEPGIVDVATAFAAVTDGDVDALEAALDAGVDVDAAVDGVPLVCAAAGSDSTDLMELLVERKANVNAPRSADGLTPLMLAAAGADADLVEMLLHHGANASLQGAAGETAEALAPNGELKALLGEAANGMGMMNAQQLAAILAPKSAARRVSVSAESIDPTKQMLAPKKVIDKSDEDRERIRATLMRSFLFKHGDAAQTADLVNAMYEVRRPRGVDIIKQGDREANEFFIIDAGECDIIKGTNEDGSERRLVTLRPGAVFGELALMYNTPRAATVRAASDEVVLWAMDRESFKAIVLVQTMQKRLKYEAFLEEVSLLQGLSSYERATVADSFVEVRYGAGDRVIEEGAEGHDMFFLVAGKAEALDKENVVRIYEKPGAYFGELALLNNEPRKATVRAATACELVALDRAAFERLMGPVVDVLQRHEADYALLTPRGSVAAQPAATAQAAQ